MEDHRLAGNTREYKRILRNKRVCQGVLGNTRNTRLNKENRGLQGNTKGYQGIPGYTLKKKKYQEYQLSLGLTREIP